MRVVGGQARKRLIIAAAELCAEVGYGALTEAAIAARADQPRAAMTELFPGGKAECALAAVETVLADGMEAVGKAYSADRSEWESVLVALQLLLEVFAERPAFARLAFIDSRHSMPSEARRRYEEGFAILTAMLDRLRVATTEAGPPPNIATRAAIGGGEALIRRELVAGRAARLPALLPHLVYTATVPFLGRREALRLARKGAGVVAHRRIAGDL
ncbi:MAG: TetR/AcrR family transcriptional regulator [Solirubrobacterales bacterium]